MALKKLHFAEGEIPIFDDACIYKRGEYWQFRMWLPNAKSTDKQVPGLNYCKELSEAKLTSINPVLIVGAKKKELTNAMKKVKCLCKHFVFIAGMLIGSFAEGWKKL